MPTVRQSGLIVDDIRDYLVLPLRSRSTFNLEASLSMARQRLGGETIIRWPLAGDRNRDLPEVDFRTESWVLVAG